MARIPKFSKRPRQRGSSKHPRPRGHGKRRASLWDYRHSAFQLFCVIALGITAYSCTSPNDGAGNWARNEAGDEARNSAQNGSKDNTGDSSTVFSADSADAFTCPSVRIIDGDTFDCGSTRIRLQGIDAPEKDGQCRPGRDCTPGDPVASTRSLAALTQFAKVQCTRTDIDHYGRTVARCSASGVDLSCEQVRRGHAVKRYARIQC